MSWRETPTDLFEQQSPMRIVPAAIGLVLLRFFLAAALSLVGVSGFLGVNVATAVTLVLLPWLLLRQQGHAPTVTLRLHRIGVSQGLWLVALGAALALPALSLAQWNSQLVPPDPQIEDVTRQLRELTSSTDWAFAGVALLLIGPFGEEILFRGIIQQACRPHLGAISSVLVTGTLFAALHLTPWVIAPLVLMGIAFGLVFEATGSLLAPILVHTTYNALMGAVFFAVPEGRDLPLLGTAAGGFVAACSLGLAVAAYGRLHAVRAWPEPGIEAT